MEELVKIVSDKTGLSDELSEKAARAVIDFIKEKLPEPIAHQVESYIEGSGPLGKAEDLTRAITGLFGRK